jgi:hypothetical protein
MAESQYSLYYLVQRVVITHRKLQMYEVSAETLACCLILSVDTVPDRRGWEQQVDPILASKMINVIKNMYTCAAD